MLELRPLLDLLTKEDGRAIRRALGDGWEVEVRPNKPTDQPGDPHYLWVRWVG